MKMSVGINWEKVLRRAMICVVLTIVPGPGGLDAWVYPEHRTIALLAIRSLDPDHRAVFERLWAAARTGNESTMCKAVADVTQGERPTCIDYAAWSAIAGDHSCSSANMIHNIVETKWMLHVAEIAAHLKHELAHAGSRTDRVNALRDSDIRFQRADQEYATRAGSNHAHFLLSRPGIGTTPRQYIDACFNTGSDLNALAVYTWYHTRALEKAGRLSREVLAADERAALSLAVLADEAFALHFLQDAFAAGHVAGTRGNASLRKGTHDYYNEHGLEVSTWAGERTILVGDAWMQDNEAALAAKAVRTSLEQVLDAAEGRGPAASLVADNPRTVMPDSFDVCATDTVPSRKLDHAVDSLLVDVFMETPVPALDAGLGEMPRFSAELGPFLGVSSALRGATLGRGFGPTQTTPDVNGGIEIAIRLGLGLEGVMNESGDGLALLDVGLRQDQAATNKFTKDPSIPEAGAITSAIPGRQAYTARLRVPFWLVPFDLLVAGPILAVASPSTIASMAVVAGNGGLIPWQTGIATSIGRFQFVLGREVGVGFYGYSGEEDRLLIPDPGSGQGGLTLVAMRSIKFDFPMLEYRPYRTFSLDQSSSLLFQLYGALDVPTRVSVEAPAGAPSPTLRSIWSIGLRVAFDWRYYW